MWKRIRNRFTPSQSKYILPRDYPEDRTEPDDAWAFRAVGAGNVVGKKARITVGRAPAEHMEQQGYVIMTSDVIGEGAFGVVFRAMWKGVEVACKVQPAGDTAKREVDLLRNVINHKNIVQVFGIFEPHPEYRDEGQVYIFMELMETDLKNFVISKGVLTEEEAQFFFKQMASGLEYLHSHGWAHRDLRTDNVLLDTSLTVAKLTDFSISSRVSYTRQLPGQTRRARSASQAGLLDCIEPQWRERNPSQGSDPQLGDVYNMGETLLFMLEGTTEEPSTLEEQQKMDIYFRRARISQNAKDFVNYLMTPRDDDRPSITQALEHPWIRNKIQVVAGRPSASTSATFGPVRPLHDRVSRLRAEHIGSGWVDINLLPPPPTDEQLGHGSSQSRSRTSSASSGSSREGATAEYPVPFPGPFTARPITRPFLNNISSPVLGSNTRRRNRSPVSTPGSSTGSNRSRTSSLGLSSNFFRSASPSGRDNPLD